MLKNTIFFVSILLFIANIYIFECIYAVSDDFAMQVIADGTLSGIPSPNLYSTSTKVGLVLNVLYSYNNSFNWYYIYILLSYLLFIMLSNYLLLNVSNKNTVFKIVIFNLLMCLALLKLQFTTIAILLSFLAFLFFLSYIRLNKISHFYIGVSLLIYSALIRFEVLYVYIFIFSIQTLYFFIVKKKFIQTIMIGLIFIVMTVNVIYEQNQISSIVGFDFDNFVKNTELIIDNPNKIDSIKFSDVGLNKYSYALLENYFFIDSEVYNHEAISKLAKGNTGLRGINEMLSILAFTIYKNWFILILLIVLPYFIKIEKTDKTIVLITKALIVFLLIFLIIFVRLPPHVSFPLFLIYFSVHIFFGEITFNKKAYFAFSLILFLYIISFTQSQTENSYKVKLSNEFIELTNKNKEALFQISRYSEVPVEAICGFENKLLNTHKNLLVYGWLVNTPAHKAQMSNLRIENQFTFMINDERVRLISNSTNFLETIANQSKIQYNKDVDFIIDKATPNYNVYKIKH